MRRVSGVVAAVALIGGLLSACGDDGDDDREASGNPAPSSSAPPEPAEESDQPEDAEAYCELVDDVRNAQAEVGNDPVALLGLLEEARDVAPDDLAQEWETVTTAYDGFVDAVMAKFAELGEDASSDDLGEATLQSLSQLTRKFLSPAADATLAIQEDGRQRCGTGS